MNTEKRETLKASDYEFSKNLVLRSLKDQVERAGICASSLPEAQPMSAEEDQILEQIVYLVKAIGEAVDRDAQCNNLVTKFAPVANLQSFRNLAEKVFNDGITWGKIATLICIIGKTIAKIIDNLVPNIVSWTLDYFKDKLLNWIHSRGGWINSISSLACYPLERDFASSSSLTSLSSGVIFISGVLLGGLIVWRLKKGA